MYPKMAAWVPKKGRGLKSFSYQILSMVIHRQVNPNHPHINFDIPHGEMTWAIKVLKNTTQHRCPHICTCKRKRINVGQVMSRTEDEKSRKQPT